MHIDAYRDWFDRSSTPYRVRLWDGRQWQFLKTHTGSIQKFHSLAAACATANRQPLWVTTKA